MRFCEDLAEKRQIWRIQTTAATIFCDCWAAPQSLAAQTIIVAFIRIRMLLAFEQLLEQETIKFILIYKSITCTHSVRKKIKQNCKYYFVKHGETNGTTHDSYYPLRDFL